MKAFFTLGYRVHEEDVEVLEGIIYARSQEEARKLWNDSVLPMFSGEEGVRNFMMEIPATNAPAEPTIIDVPQGGNFFSRLKGRKAA